MVPDAKQAGKLEMILQRLGFHKRASGTLVDTVGEEDEEEGKGKKKVLVFKPEIRPPPSEDYYWPEYMSPFR